MTDREGLADLLMSDRVMNTDAMGRDYALFEADAILTSDWLQIHDADVAKTMQMRIASEVHGLPSYGTSPDDNHFDLPGEADKTVVMRTILGVDW